MKARYFVALSVLLFGVTILGLRHNNIEAYNMRDKILEKDAAGEKVEQDLQKLQDFVFSRMNASGSGGMRIVLEGAYERAVAKAQAEAEQSIDGSVYDAAVEECDREGVTTTQNAECVQNYVEQRLNAADEQINMPDKKQFTYVLHSPKWAADLPGISLLLAIISVILSVVLYLKYWFSVLTKQ